MSYDAGRSPRFSARDYDDHRKGKLVWKTDPNGNRRVENPFRHNRKLIKRAYGVRSGRQWVKLRKRLQRDRRAAGRLS